MNRLETVLGGLAAGFTCGFLCGFFLMVLVGVFSPAVHGVALYFEIPVVCTVIGTVAGPFVFMKFGQSTPPGDKDQDGKIM